MLRNGESLYFRIFVNGDEPMAWAEEAWKKYFVSAVLAKSAKRKRPHPVFWQNRFSTEVFAVRAMHFQGHGLTMRPVARVEGERQKSTCRVTEPSGD